MDDDLIRHAPFTTAQLEGFSDSIRRGEPIGFLEALAAVDYQQALREERDAARAKTLWGRMRRWLRQPWRNRINFTKSQGIE